MSTLASLTLLLLISVSVTPAQTCVDNTFQCSGCGTLVACFGGTEYPIPCATGQVCGNDGANADIDGCFDVSDSSNTELSECSCDASATSASYTADPYDAAKYLACIPGDAAPQSLACTGTDVFLGEGQIPPCGVAPDTTTGPTTQATTTPIPFACTTVGFSADTSVCSKYWLCSSATDAAPIEVNCDAGQVFNEATLACFDPCDSSAVTFSCDGITGGVADSVNCSIFHICVNGVPIGQPVPCADPATFFNPETSACDATTCATDGNSCLTCSTTTAGTTSTSSDSTASDSTASDLSASDSTDSDSTDSDSTDSDSTDSDSTDSDSTDSDSTDSDSTDSDSTDSDSTMTDSTMTDSTMTDSTMTDSSMTDSTMTDSSMTDSTMTDSTMTDYSMTDSTMTDSTMTDSTITDLTTVGIADCSSATEGGYFSDADSCKTFYACEPDTAGGYELKKYTCPGSLVFDPTNNYCNLASLVPGC